MADVARVAGVSAQTVSRTLSGHPNVRPETGERVFAAADSLNYRYNATARALASGRTHTLGLVVQSTAAYASAAVIHAVAKSVTGHGYALSLATVDAEGGATLVDALRQLSNHGVDGIVLAVPNGDESAARLGGVNTIPMVLLDPVQPAHAPSVTVDQAAIGRVATEHLLDQGHRTVYFVGGEGSWAETESRVAGWRVALEAAGAPVPEPDLGGWSPQAGFDAGQRLMATSDVTAVFAASDEVAIGVIRAVIAAGKRVPEDVSVVGVDDIPVAEMFTPPLTTVRQPWFDIADAAVACLVADDGAGARVFAPEIVVRRSTAEPPKS